jgi:hypothetical protein
LRQVWSATFPNQLATHWRNTGTRRIFSSTKKRALFENAAAQQTSATNEQISVQKRVGQDKKPGAKRLFPG